ncbi:Y-family DNA polymerase [Lysobacter xanthus]
MRWACIFLPQLALDGLLRRLDDPASPLALVHGPVQRRTLLAVNAAAREAGLKPGMTMAAAQALGVPCRTVEHDPRAAERLREFLAAWAYRYSSQVSLDLSHAVVLEASQSRRLFGEWPQLERRLRDDLVALGIRHRITAAPNPHAARMLANVHDGLAVDAHALHNALGQLPIERAGLPRDIVDAFLRMGLRRLRQVLALPRESMVRRFPPSLVAHLDRLCGHDPTPLQWYRPPDRFEARIEFEYDVESSLALLFPLRRLTHDLATFLCSRDGGVQRFMLVLEHERCAPTEVVVGLLTPEREASILFELARGRIENARLPAATRGMRLVAQELPPFVPAARDLFETRPQQAVPWTQLRERLRARLGDEAVHGLGWRADHRPEQAMSGATAVVPAQVPNVPRPGWLLPRPMPLQDRCVRILAGPERIESGWWDADDVRRDYYLVETARGQRVWAFCLVDDELPAAPMPDRMMVHGWFG